MTRYARLAVVPAVFPTIYTFGPQLTAPAEEHPIDYVKRI